jgi:iron complex outermembrane recepter protein
VTKKHGRIEGTHTEKPDNVGCMVARRKPIPLMVAAYVGAMLNSGPVVAQTAGDIPPANDSASGALTEIVVTAQKRSENIQNVPIAIAAVTSTALESAVVTDVLDLRMSVPGLNVVNTNGYITPFLRGVGSLGVGPGIENPVATYVDGVYLGATTTTLVGFTNIQQVEVLKGPQGTLFGRNATGGLIQITTKDPTPDLSGAFHVTYGNYDTVSADAYVAGGLTDTLRADVSVRTTHQGEGWGRNIATGGETYAVDYDSGFRSKWIFQPSDATKLTFIGDYSDTSNSMNTDALLAGTVNVFTPTPATYPHGYDANTNSPSVFQGYQAGGSLRWDQSFEHLNFASITAYRKSSYLNNFDFDASPINFETLRLTQVDKQLTQEIQLLSPSGNKLTWVAGAFYDHATGGYDPFDALLPILDTDIRVRSTQKTNSIAGYGQATYEVLPATNITLGARYTAEKKSLDGTQLVLAGQTQVAALAVNQERTFDKLTFRAAVDHHFSADLMSYASFNRGFKSGGFNAGLPPGLGGYDPEVLDATEIGVKSSFLDRSLQVNAAGFYYKYKDIQQQILDAGTVGVVNAGGAKLYGIETDVESQVGDHLLVTLSMNWLHTAFTSFPNAPTSVANGSLPTVPGSATGNNLPMASKATANLGFDYRINLVRAGALNLNTTVYYNDGWYAEADNVIKQRPFTMVNASAKWLAPDKHFSLMLWGKNLNNIQTFAFETATNAGSQLVWWAAPRTYGITAGYEF